MEGTDAMLQMAVWFWHGADSESHPYDKKQIIGRWDDAAVKRNYTNI